MRALHGSGREVAVEAPHHREVPVEVDADRSGTAAAWRGPAVLPPHRLLLHAEVAAIRIHLRHQEHVLRLHDLPDLRGRVGPPARADARAVAVGPEQPNREVDQGVGAAPFASVHAADEADAGAPTPAALADPQGVAAPFLPGAMWKGNPLDVARVALGAQGNRPFDLVRREVAAGPDHVAVTALPQPSGRGLAILRLPLPGMALDLLETRDAVPMLLEPLRLPRRHVRVDLDATFRVLAVADHEDAMLGSEFRQMPTVTPGDSDVVEGHSTTQAIAAPTNTSTRL